MKKKQRRLEKSRRPEKPKEEVRDLAEHRYWNHKDWIAWFCCLGFVLFLICFEGVVLR